MRLRTRYALWGALLGLGAPLGSLAWRVISKHHQTLLAVLAEEWQRASYYYVYMSIGTVLAMSLYGYFVGSRNETLSKLSITDGLTHLYNHRYLQERLVQEIHRTDRSQSPLTCLMIDIDDFKKVNDQHGHPFGDEVLYTTAQLIRKSLRKIDLVGRYGGEEFLVLMPQTTAEEALPISQRILETVQGHTFPCPGGPARITLSIGLATYPAPELGIKTKNALLSATDQALYKAKLSGKNRAVVWQP